MCMTSWSTVLETVLDMWMLPETQITPEWKQWLQHCKNKNVTLTQQICYRSCNCIITIVYPISCLDIHVFHPFLMFPHVIGYSCPIDSLTVKLINKRDGLECQQEVNIKSCFKKGRIGMSRGRTSSMYT